MDHSTEIIFRPRAFRSRLTAWSKTRLAAVVLVCVLCALLSTTAQHAQVALAGAIAVLVLGIACPWLIIASVRAGLSTSSSAANNRVTVGEKIDFLLITKNALPISLPSFALDFGVIELTKNLLQFETPTFACPAGNGSVVLRARANCRGVIDLSAIRLVTSFPLGLITARRTISAGGELIIWPVAIEIDESMLTSAAQAFSTDWVASRISNTGELSGVRNYRRGDSMRSIHWQQTSRHGRLIVTERAGGESRQMHVRLDTRASSFTDDADFERAVSTVAGIIDLLSTQPVTLHLHMGETRIVVSDEQSRISAMDALACVAMVHDLGSTETFMQLAPGNAAARAMLVTSPLGWQSIPAESYTPMIVQAA